MKTIFLLTFLIFSSLLTASAQTNERNRQNQTGRCNNGAATYDPDPVRGCEKDDGLAYKTIPDLKPTTTPVLAPVATPVPEPTPPKKEELVGDLATKTAYPRTCANISLVRNPVSFGTYLDALKQGYVVAADRCPGTRPKAPVTSETVAVVRPKTILEVLSAPEEYADKIITIRASIRLSAGSRRSEDTYSFYLEDDSTGQSIDAYMEKGLAAKLRAILIDGNDGTGSFVGFIDPLLYHNRHEIMFRITSYRVVK